MNIPRQVSPRLLATLAAACLVTALPLTRAAAQDAPAKPQSPNGKIVFQSTQGSDGFTNDIYVMAADGKHQTRLTDDTADDVSAVWSPQGDRIAFLSSRRGNGYEIYLMNPDGSDQRPLREASPVVPFSAFRWSPDGTRLAYANSGSVYVIAVDGISAPVNVSVYKSPDSSDTDPNWSPLGDKLVVLNFTACGGCSDLYVVNASDGSGRYQLSTGTGFDASPRWAPAGDLIAYEGDRAPYGRGLYVTPADGMGPETLVSGGAGSFGGPAWSADGSRLAFRSGVGVPHAVNADGSGLTPLTDVQSTTGDIFWSPDGSLVAFHNSNADGWVDIFVVASDGTSRRAANYTKTRRADEFAYSWQKLPTP